LLRAAARAFAPSYASSYLQLTASMFATCRQFAFSDFCFWLPLCNQAVTLQRDPPQIEGGWLSGIPAKSNNSYTGKRRLRRIPLLRGSLYPTEIQHAGFVPVTELQFVAAVQRLEAFPGSSVCCSSAAGSGERSAMSLVSTCGCLLCHVESRLLAEFKSSDAGPYRALPESSDHLPQVPSILVLLSELRASAADPRSDELFRNLLAARESNPQLVETLLVLAFLPMLHHTIRRVAQHQPTLSPDDITQQALTTLLEFLCSEQLRMRTSYFAFAISRAVKRQMFEWANREGSVIGPREEANGELFAALVTEEPFERHALLRHFLDRCVSKGLLTSPELELLAKLNVAGTNGDSDGSASAEHTTNAGRQRTKRLLAKLRRLAR
jgi:hypothetical protein